MNNDKKKIRCAIYTRKSHEEGLDQDFNSLDAQRSAAEAYIQSQVHEGWKLLPTRYDDGGFSGGNMDRPALSALIEDIRAGKIDCVVVYIVDRHQAEHAARSLLSLKDPEGPFVQSELKRLNAEMKSLGDSIRGLESGLNSTRTIELSEVTNALQRLDPVRDKSFTQRSNLAFWSYSLHRSLFPRTALTSTS